MTSIPKGVIDIIYSFVGSTRNNRCFMDFLGDAARFQAICDFLVSREYSLEEFFRRPRSPSSLRMTQFYRQRHLYMLRHVILRRGEAPLSLPKLLKLGLDPNGAGFACDSTYDDLGVSYLQRLITSCGSCEEKVGIARCLLQAEADPNIAAMAGSKETGDRLMHEAAKHSWGDCAIFGALLRAGGDPKVVNRLGFTPLQYFNYASLTQASGNGEIVRVERILKQGLPYELLSHGLFGNETALEAAITRGRVVVVEALLQAGVDPIHNSRAVIQALLPSPIDSNTSWSLRACICIIQLLLEFGFSLDTPGCHPLAQSTLFRRWPGFKVLVRFLLRAGADPGGGVKDIAYYRSAGEPLSKEVVSLIWGSVWIRFAKRTLAHHTLELDAFSDACKEFDVTAQITSNSARSSGSGEACILDVGEVLMNVQREGSAALEPVAVIDPEEAAIVSEVLWASAVQSLAAGDVARATASQNRHIVVMQFSRDQRAFDEALLRSSIARRARAHNIEIKPTWANGAKIFVAGVRLDDLLETGIEICSRHVVVYESDVQEVESNLDVLPSHSRPRLKPNCPIVSVPLEGSLSMFGELTDTATSPSINDTSSLAATYPSKVSEPKCLSTGSTPSRCWRGVPIKFTFLHYDLPEEDCPSTHRSF